MLEAVWAQGTSCHQQRRCRARPDRRWPPRTDRMGPADDDRRRPRPPCSCRPCRAVGCWVAERSRAWREFWRSAAGRDGFYPFNPVAAACVREPTRFGCARVTAWVGLEPSDGTGRRSGAGFRGSKSSTQAWCLAAPLPPASATACSKSTLPARRQGHHFRRGGLTCRSGWLSRPARSSFTA